MRYHSTRPRKQFLAGVKCPKCQKTDCIQQVNIYLPEPDEYIQCTECEYVERRPDANAVRQKNLAHDATKTKTSNLNIPVVSLTDDFE